MNKDQAKGSVKIATGKVEKKVGKATANGTQVVKGSVRELAGKAQKAYGDARSNRDARQREERRAR